MIAEPNALAALVEDGYRVSKLKSHDGVYRIEPRKQPRATLDVIALVISERHFAELQQILADRIRYFNDLATASPEEDFPDDTE